MKKIFNFIVTLFLGLSLISLVSAYDQGLPENCGGDNELVISCLGDQEIVFLGGLAPSSVGGLHVGIGPESTNISSKTKVVIPIEKEKKPLLLPILLVMFISFFLIFIYKRKKDKEKEEREKEKEKKKQDLNSLIT